MLFSIKNKNQNVYYSVIQFNSDLPVEGDGVLEAQSKLVTVIFIIQRGCLIVCKLFWKSWLEILEDKLTFSD